MHVIQGDTINDVIMKVLEKVIIEGVSISSRNGNALTLYDVSLILKNPRSRHLSLLGRKNNIFSTFAEALWVLAGENEIEPYLSFFLPRAHEYSDDGISWRAAYGKRLYSYGQIENVIRQFKEEGIYTRRAVISLYMPNLDTSESLLKKYNLKNSLDIPCNNLIHFFVTPDKKLNIKITQRSGDLIFGISNINIFEFSLLQEMILFILKKEVDNELSLGYLHQSVTNLHIYNTKMQQAREILNNKEKQILDNRNEDDIFFANSLSETKKLINEVKDFIKDRIVDIDIEPYKEAREKLNVIFSMYSVPCKNNLLWGYSDAILSYVYQEKINHLVQPESSLSSDFKLSVNRNHYNKNSKEFL